MTSDTHNKYVYDAHINSTLLPLTHSLNGSIVCYATLTTKGNQHPMYHYYLLLMQVVKNYPTSDINTNPYQHAMLYTSILSVHAHLGQHILTLLLTQ